MNATILVTGGAGYIGSVTCKLLARAGYLPVVCDNLVRGHRWAVRWGPLEEQDLSDLSALYTIFRTYRPIAVLHFAAYAYVGESMREPEFYFENNVVNSLRLLRCMRDCGTSTIVYSSSCATYGLPSELPIKETHPQDPINPYGESKRSVERALHWYGIAYDFQWTALRYFNASGADLEGEVGEEHSPETHLVPLCIEAALGLRSHVEVYGIDYPTPDGTAIRDYVHVTDLAEAHVRALEYLLRGNRSNAFNLGSGSGYSVRQIVNAVELATGVKGISCDGKRRPGDPPELVADATNAKKALRWQPQYSDLDTIVRTALQWHTRRTYRQ